MTELQTLKDKNAELEKQLSDIATKFAAFEKSQAGTSNATTGRQVNVAGGNMPNFISTTTTLNTPKLEKGMTYEDYEYDVKLWMASGLVAKDKQALLLINEFPSKDDRDMKKTVVDAIGIDNLGKDDGAQRVLDELAKILKCPTFVRLASWLETFESVKQGSGTFDRFMTKLKGMKKMAKDEFKFNVPPMIMVAKMLQGCSRVTPENIGIITQGLKLDEEGQDIEAKVEANIKQFVSTVGVFSKDQNRSQAFFTKTDLFGNPIEISPKKSKVGLVNDPTQDQEYQAYLAAKRTKQEDREERQERLRKEGKCYEYGCESTEHRFFECPKRAAGLERKRKNEGNSSQNPNAGKKAPAAPSKAFFLQTVNGENIQMNATSDDCAFSDDEDNDEPRHPNRIFITGLHDEDGEVGPSPVIGLEGPPRPEKSFVSSLESTRVDEQIFDVNWSSEIKDKAIIDSGCSKSVAGSAWFQGFMETLSDQDKKAIQKYESNAKFKFGGHGIYLSQALVIAPVYVGGKRIFIRFDIVETDIPLLISLKVMKRLEMNMQYSKDGQDLATVRGVTFKLTLLDGHHWISLSQSGSLASVVSRTDDTGNEDSLSGYLSQPKVFDAGKEVEQLRKIHVNRAHMPKHKMINLLKTVGHWNKDIQEKLDQMIEDCDVMSAFRVAKEVGDIVAVDLKIRPGKKDILYVSQKPF